jgi:hypothetical protein
MNRRSCRGDRRAVTVLLRSGIPGLSTLRKPIPGSLSSWNGLPVRVLIPMLLSSFLAAQGVPEQVSTARDRTGLGITLYRGDLAVIQDERRIALPAGAIRLAFADVSAEMNPRSALFESSGVSRSMILKGQSCEFDLITPKNLLKKSFGERIRFQERDSESSGFTSGILVSSPTEFLRSPPRTPLEAALHPLPLITRLTRLHRRVLVKADPDVLLQTEEGLMSLGKAQHLAFPKLPEGLRSRPTLIEELENPEAGLRDLRLTYLSKGFTWWCSYVAEVQPDGRSVDLSGWVTLTNLSGMNFKEARLQLVAGKPNQVSEEEASNDPDLVRESRCNDQITVCASEISPVFREEKIGDNMLLTLDRAVDLKDRQTKQIRLLAVEGIQTTRRFVSELPYAQYSSPSDYLAGATFVRSRERDSYSPIPLPSRLPDSEELQSRPWKRNGQTTDEALRRWEFDLIDAEQNRELACLTLHPRVMVNLKLQNDLASGLGRPIPEGVMQVWTRTPQGSVWLSEVDVQDTPLNEEIVFAAGSTSMIRVDRKVVSIHRKSKKALHQKSKQRMTYTYEIEAHVTSGLGDSSLIKLREPVFAGWKLIESNHSGTRSGPNAYDFEVPVSAGGHAILRYRVRTNPVNVVIPTPVRP